MPKAQNSTPKIPKSIKKSPTDDSRTFTIYNILSFGLKAF